ncbi:MAG: isoprenylcysteine carboxylmethyltransferase family protein [Candidatus Omnitrophica bacterium]|nr:isoprenylcysteine carboxylmethyltransferase family protein [Candidatus Omnitrophota bacterium]
MRFFFDIRVPAGWVFFILVALTGKMQNFWPLIFVIAGEWIRTVAAGTIKKNEMLATTGIYRIVRHPLYFGSFNISLGFCLMSSIMILWIYMLIFFPLCYGSTIILEERHLDEKFGKTFKEYKKSVSSFFPLKIPVGSIKSDFSLTQAFRNKEHHNWFVLLILLFILILKRMQAF